MQMTVYLHGDQLRHHDCAVLVFVNKALGKERQERRIMYGVYQTRFLQPLQQNVIKPDLQLQQAFGLIPATWNRVTASEHQTA